MNKKQQDTIILKCEKCGVESLTDSKFCSNCGERLQPDKVRTVQEIKEMQEKIKRKSRNLGNDISSSMVTLMVGMGMDTALLWVMGMMNSNRLLGLLEITRNKNLKDTLEEND